MLKDLSYALRNMVKNPGLTIIVVLTLALGIGANTAMFSVVNAVLLRPLPYSEPQRLVTISAQIPSMNIFGAFVEYNTFVDYWRGQGHAFESMWAYTPDFVNLTAGEPARLYRIRVNAGFLGLLGLHPQLGREFLAAEDQPGAPRVAMLSNRLWRGHFGGDRSILGREIQLDGQSYTIVGVLPAGFDFYDREVDIYSPIASPSARVAGMPSVGVHGRLKPGVSLASAQAELDGLCRRWLDATHYPRDWGARLWTVHDYAVRQVRSSVLVLAVAVGLVLLIACANVANLLMARAAARQREIAIRGALGASPGRIARQLLTESSVLAALAVVVGLAAAWGAVRVLVASSGYLPFQDMVSIDGKVLGFTALAGVLTTLLFGLMPALAATRSNLPQNLQESGRVGEGSRRHRLRASLVVVEVALALLLTIGATLTARSLARLQAMNPGFRPEGVLTANLSLPTQTYPRPDQQISFYRALLERLNHTPGVQSAAAVSHLPFSYSKSGESFIVEGAPPLEPGQRNIAFLRRIDPKYFATLEVPLLRGRFFDEHDPAGPPVAIINQAMARRFWPEVDPIGKRFGPDGKTWISVVGVAGDMRQTSLADPPDLEVYLPYAEMPEPSMSLVVRTPQDSLHFAPTLRGVVRELDKELPISDMNTLSGNIQHSTREQRFTVTLLAAFGALALVLAAVGIYGVMSYSVNCRTQEIGVRMAMGAERGSIVRMVVKQALRLGAMGVAVGVAGGFAVTHLMRSLLFGVSTHDPLIFTASALFLLLIAALAAYVPARRAARVDPIVALRHE